MKRSIASFAAAAALAVAGAFAAPSEAEAGDCKIRGSNSGLSLRCPLGQGGIIQFDFNNRGNNNIGGNQWNRHNPSYDWERQQRQCDNMATNYYRTRERLYYQGRDGFSPDERRTLQRMEDNMARRGCYLR